MLLAGAIFILLILNVIFIQYSFKNSLPGTDHYWHLEMIKEIKGNNHRFMSGFSNWISEENFCYPQLYHWILSFLPITFIKEKGGVIGIIISTLTLSLVLGYSIFIYPLLNTQLSIEELVLFSGFLYLTTPTNFLGWNSKNTGLSARGIGILFGYIYVFITSLYLIHGNFEFLLLIYFISYIILLSSQFAFQFIIFFSILSGLFFSNIFLILNGVIVSFLFLITHRKIAISFFKGQFWHKKKYAKYISFAPILIIRYSIWRDLVYDIWKVLIKKSIPAGIAYAIYNPFITVIFWLPYFTILLFLLIQRDLLSLITNNPFLYNHLIFITICLITFFITSFRQTRFLGEPQRYLEFVIPSLIIILLSNSFFSRFEIILIIIYNIIASLFNILFNRIKAQKQKATIDKKASIAQIYRDIVSYFKENSNQDIRVFSNNQNITKSFMGSGFQYLMPSIGHPYCGKFHFTEFCGNRFSFKHLSPAVIIQLIEEFNIDYFILDESFTDNYSEIKKSVYLEQISIIHDRIIYKVNLNHDK